MATPPTESVNPISIERRIGDNLAQLNGDMSELFRFVGRKEAEVAKTQEDFEMLNRAYRSLKEENNQLQLRMTEHERHKQNLESQLHTLQRTERRVYALIDGDDTIFSIDLMNRGREGGLAAASRLGTSIKRYLNADDHLVLYIYIFVNKRGLASALHRYGLVDQSTYAEFFVGFNHSSERYLVIDVGDGKEMADSRIKSYLNDHMRSSQTWKVFFGGLSDNGYVLTIQSFITNGLKDKLVLIPGVTPVATSYQNLALPFLNIPDLFMTTKVGSHMQTETSTSLPAEVPLATPPGLPIRRNTVSNNATSPVDSSAPIATVIGRQSLMANTLASSELVSHVERGSPIPSEASTTSVISSPSRTRVFASTSNPSSTIGKIKLKPNQLVSKLTPPACNHFYLTEDCRSGNSCKYGHQYILLDQHYEELAMNAKKSPCPFLNLNASCFHGERCIYGHKCPQGPKCFYRIQGKCRFTGEGMHKLS